MRQLRKLLRPSQKAARPPTLTVQAIRQQLPHMSPEDREYTQQLLADEPSLKKALAQSKDLEDQQLDEMPLEEVVTHVLENANSQDELDDTFWSSVQLLIKKTQGPQNVEKRIENVPLFVKLFEAAKLIQGDGKSDLIYQIGTYIYRLKMLRFDPVNEAVYLDSLIQHGAATEALALWNSRKERPEVVDTIYWWDIGVLYHLESGLYHGADLLARSMHEKFKYVSPRAVCELIKVHKDMDVKEFWLNYLFEAQKVPVEGSEDFLMQKSTFTIQQLSDVFNVLAVTENYDLALQLVDNTTFSIEFAMYPRVQTKRSAKTKATLNDVIGAVIGKYPDVLHNSAMYGSWIYLHLLAKNYEEATDILGIMRQHGISFTEVEVVTIIKELLEASKLDIAKELIQEYDTPEVAIVYLDYLNKSEPNMIPEYIEGIECDLTPDLAEKILATGGHIDYPLLDLCVNHRCWKEMWRLIRDKDGMPTPRSAFEKMIHGEYLPAINLFETVLQAFIVSGDRVGATAVLAYLQTQKQLFPNKLILTSIAALLEDESPKFSSSVDADLLWPKTGPLAQPVSLEKIAKLLDVDLSIAQKLAETWA